MLRKRDSWLLVCPTVSDFAQWLRKGTKILNEALLEAFCNWYPNMAKTKETLPLGFWPLVSSSLIRIGKSSLYQYNRIKCFYSTLNLTTPILENKGNSHNSLFHGRVQVKWT